MSADALALLRALLELMPPGSQVGLPRDWLLNALPAVATPEARTYGVDVLSVKDVCRILVRSPSTVRGWLEAGLIPGAWKLRGRDWRITPEGLTAFLSADQRGQAAPAIERHRHNLGAWRKQRKERGVS